MDSSKVGEVYPEDGPNSQHGLESWQLSIFLCAFSAFTHSQWLQLTVAHSTLTVHLGSRSHIDNSTNNHHSQHRSADYRYCCFMLISLIRKLWSNTRERTQNGEKELRTTLFSKVLELCSEKNSSEELSRERWQSNRCTSRLWRSSIWTSLGTSEQGSLDLTHISILALSNVLGYSWVAFQKLLWKVNCELRRQEWSPDT